MGFMQVLSSLHHTAGWHVSIPRLRALWSTAARCRGEGHDHQVALGGRARGPAVRLRRRLGRACRGRHVALDDDPEERQRWWLHRQLRRRRRHAAAWWQPAAHQRPGAGGAGARFVRPRPRVAAPQERQGRPAQRVRRQHDQRLLGRVARQQGHPVAHASGEATWKFTSSISEHDPVGNPWELPSPLETGGMRGQVFADLSDGTTGAMPTALMPVTLPARPWTLSIEGYPWAPGAFIALGLTDSSTTLGNLAVAARISLQLTADGQPQGLLWQLWQGGTPRRLLASGRTDDMTWNRLVLPVRPGHADPGRQRQWPGHRGAVGEPGRCTLRGLRRQRRGRRFHAGHHALARFMHHRCTVSTRCTHERRSAGPGLPEPPAQERADRHQPVLPALPDAEELGLRPHGQARARRVDRGDEARRQADGPHPDCSKACPTCRTWASC